MDGLLLMGILTVVLIGIAKLRRAVGPRPIEMVQDSCLGDLRFDPDVEAWRTVVDSPGGRMGFQITGSVEPDPRLVVHARELARSSRLFLQEVRDFLQREARDQPRWAEQIAALELEEVCLLWPKRPNDGMLYFAGPDSELRIWRCDYVDRKPIGLGFDS